MVSAEAEVVIILYSIMAKIAAALSKKPLRSSIVPAMPTRTWPVPSPTSATTLMIWVSVAQATRSGVVLLVHGWQRHWAIVPIYAH